MIQGPQNAFSSYHAHVYFDEGTVEQARQLCQAAAAQFGVTMGRVHEKLVGPHPRWSCQLTFDGVQFEGLIPWLDAHRGNLNILVHPRTGDSLEDHTRYASWLGEAVELNLAALKSVAVRPPL